MRVDAEIHGAVFRAQAGERAGEVAVEDGVGEGVDGGEGGAGGGGVGGVGLDEDGRAFAAEEFAGEILGDVDDELDVAELEEARGLGFGGGLAHEVEVVAGAEGLHEGAGERPLVGGADGGGEVTRVGVDGVAEHQQLHERDADHHAEGHAVAFHLDELFQHDGPEAVEREAVHEKLSFAVSMRPMNTSSRPARMGVHV